MDKFAEALIKLVETGGPLAGEAIRWYYLTEMTQYVLTAGTILGVVGLIVWTVRWGMNRVMTHDERRFPKA